MTDVRLTATNPEDSSVVPVACNSRGELLIEEVKVEAIENDVTIDGTLILNLPGTESVSPSTWSFGTDGNFSRISVPGTKTTHSFTYSGYAEHSRIDHDNKGVVAFSSANRAISVQPPGQEVWYVTWNGVASASNFQIALEPDNPSHYSVLKSGNSEEPDVRTYQGPVLDVREELQFLRAQVRTVMERLKMVPEEGWPVWDGSD